MACRTEVTAHFNAYRELLFGDFAEEVGDDGLQDILVPGPIDPDTGMPTEVRVPVCTCDVDRGCPCQLASFRFVQHRGQSREST